MFAELATVPQTYPQTGFSGFAGFGAFAGIEDPNAVLIGTRLRIKFDVEVYWLGWNLWSITETFLDAVSAELRKGGYVILSRSSSYGEATYDVEVRIEKVNLEGVLQDFSGSINAVIGSSYQAVNLRLDKVLYNPRDHQTTTTPSGGTRPAGQGGVTQGGATPDAYKDSDKAAGADSNAPKGFLESIQSFLDKKFGFLGGTVSGAVLIAIGIGVIAFIKRD